MQQLHERRGEAEVHAHLLGVVAQHDLAVRHVLEARELGVGRPAGDVSRGPVLVDGGLRIVGRLEEQLEAGLLQAILVPVDGLAGVLRPNMVEARVAVAVGVAHQVVADFVLVDFAAGLLLQAAVDRTQVVAHAAADGSLLQAHHLGALFGSRACGEQAGRAGTAHEHLGVDGLDDFVLGDFRLFAQPVVHGGSGLVFLRRCSCGRAARQAGPCKRGRRSSSPRLRGRPILFSCPSWYSPSSGVYRRRAPAPRAERPQLHG